FREVLAELESKISTAEFLAIDGEFTGLHGTGQDVNAFDTPSQYYSKLRSNCMDFLLIQFGLCIFKYDEEKNKYTHRAYNFYIFPRGQTRSASDSRFLCQSSSIEFLASQGFDFNKLFKEGIPYLTQPEEQKMRENLEEKHKSEANSENNLEEPPPPIPIPDQHVSFIEDVCSKIEQFLESSESEELQLDQCNAFVRKLIYQEVGKRFDSNKLVLESRISDNKNRILFALRTGSEEVKKRKEKERMERELRELEDAIGFTSITHLNSHNRGKLMIGHNMLLDICHILHQCYFPLPTDYSEFKELIRCVFPNILDTKYMSFSSVFKESINSNVLEHLHKTLSEKPFKMFTAECEMDGCGYSSVNEKYHEAGYDAYITGLCYIAMANHIGSLQKPETYPVRSSSSLLKPYVNKLFLLKVQDSPFINLVGKIATELPRNHVFFISFPKDWKTSDITKLFSPFGAVFIAWINESSAFVALYKRDQASTVKKTLTKSDTYTLIPYEAYQKLQDTKAKTRVEYNSGTRKVISCSSLDRNRKRHTIQGDPELSLKRTRTL
ncbi:hypothetical protein L9F63_017315, partial [Diploptera punctata]